MTTRENYQAKVETQLKEWQAKIETMGLKAKGETQKQLEALSAHQKAASQKLEQLKQASEETWERVKSSLENDLATLDKGVKQVEKRVGLGWPQGQASERDHSSEGWPEGQGYRDPDSEGWLQGQGHQTSDSAGWPEGQTTR